MKCKDIPTKPILEFLLDNGGIGCNCFDMDFDRSVIKAMPENTPKKLALSKMKNLIKKGLVKGCSCGCRGDFEVTQKGIEAIGVLSIPSNWTDEQFRYWKSSLRQ